MNIIIMKIILVIIIIITIIIMIIIGVVGPFRVWGLGFRLACLVKREGFRRSASLIDVATQGTFRKLGYLTLGFRG